MRRRRIGVADYRFGARLHSEIAQPLRVPFACSRKTNDGSRNRLARRVDYAPVMQGLDGEFECDAQETRRLWIEPLPVKIFSDRHVKNRAAPVAFKIVRKGAFVGPVPDQNTQATHVAFVARRPFAYADEAAPRLRQFCPATISRVARADDEDKKHAVNHRSHEPAEMGGIGHRDTACHPDDHKKEQRRPLAAEACRSSLESPSGGIP